MRLVLLGAPGAGKGTQAVVISQKYNVPHISTGDIFRSNIKNGTELGRKAKEYIDKGLLVPDELTVDIVKDRISQPDCKAGFILDGFPRTIYQAERLDEILKELNVELDCALNIYVPDEEIIKRMSGRRVCSKCGMSYHIVYNQPKVENICDSCNGELIQRDDDKEETVIQRLNTYHKQTEPLIEYYEKKGKLLTVHGQEGVDDTTKEVLNALSGVKL
ncbi:MAG TPA: adenylate kinase [Hungateiclostridium thermocellum]|jgi:adenylate kinase|uniref:Adenylate kinase n=2 Tax=Acetivibrio thermocellus TaxID=1515 RepID=KAD_ACET2|nr:adenylate kinase [Acetivibrio thermocellus]A3DJJ3.1 RecName: Full=Adenylate kinase; Short=AK; AltName: Full=ATP-AMP transphosphorylase; AltName: Full=ATP:AMP phosphotransferase; AltName: Full=Adenylate monophosphate kinase [Acetivibrio thermocellus ATCC 27405]CDG37415.1 Adenylate kinase [Acetivibrio thermocellus BC1]ABN54122.1 adenylate kinase [Acetivibrio thermocellus ATCC 27405]ADU73555.1 adenylate kinase [Acetivibrio thermocellus DSM 1313]ALX07476.1 Adenylate kinase [Acetivibrio thermoce